MLYKTQLKGVYLSEELKNDIIIAIVAATYVFIPDVYKRIKRRNNNT